MISFSVWQFALLVIYGGAGIFFLGWVIGRMVMQTKYNGMLEESTQRMNEARGLIQQYQAAEVLRQVIGSGAQVEQAPANGVSKNYWN